MLWPVAAAKPAPERKRLTAEQRRSLLLDAAWTCFDRDGFAGTTMEQVAREAGVSKALIYEHFASKGELAGALLDREMPAVQEGVLAAVRAADDPVTSLRGGLRAFFSWVAARPTLFRLAVVEAARDPELALRREQTRDQLMEALIGVITEQARRQGREPQFASRIAHAIAGAAESVAVEMTRARDVPAQGDLDAELLTHVFWLGLERLAEGDVLPGIERPRPA